MGGKKNNKGKAGGKKEAPPMAQFAYDNEGGDETPAQLKERGNALVKAGDHEKAILVFGAAIERSPPKEDLHLYHSNWAMCAIALKRYDEATAAAEKCVALQPKWAKGYGRLGSAHFFAGRTAESIKAYAAGLAIDPTNASITEGLAMAQAALKPGKKDKQPAKDATKEGRTEAPKEKAAPKEEGKGQVVGIDLGTTYSCVAVCVKGAGRVEVIPNADGSRTTPSWVAFSAQDGTRLVGQAAKNQAAANPTNTINDAKRLIGRGFHDEGLQKDLKHFSYSIKESDGKPNIQLSSACWDKPRLYLPEQISAMVLEQLKLDAEAFLGEPISRCVITVPAHFNDAQRQATKDAGAIAGLQVMRIINEPTAAALAYGLGAKVSKETKVLVFDLGGGTFDVSILSLEGGIFEVKATGGNTRLGGEDFDANIVQFLVQGFMKQHKGTVLTERAQRRLYAAAERAKRHVSAATQADVEVEALADGHDLKAVLTRAKFESLNADFFNSCIDTVKAVMKDAKMEKKEIDEVVLVGGSTRIPKIRELLSAYFGGKQLCSSINPDEAVAYGAAVQAGVLGGGLAAAGGELAKAASELVLMDVTPLSLGIETTGKVMSTVVKRNTPIPTRKTDIFTTEEDNQTEVDICVYEGERASTDACNLLGQFTISGLERAKRGEPQVKVTFDLDANGILSVTAQDKNTGAKANIIITSTNSRNSKADVERMVAEGEKFAVEDAKLQAKADARRELDDMIFDVMDDDSSASDRQKEAAEEAEDWMRDSFDGCSVDDIRKKLASLRAA